MVAKTTHVINIQREKGRTNRGGGWAEFVDTSEGEANVKRFTVTETESATTIIRNFSSSHPLSTLLLKQRGNNLALG